MENEWQVKTAMNFVDLKRIGPHGKTTVIIALSYTICCFDATEL